MKARMFTGAALGLLGLTVSAFAAPPVRLWETNLVIPTYLAAPPSPVPRFYEGRTYQGAKATFYPYPVQDVLTDTRTNRTYRALFLENQHLQISVIPELGGRIWSALDKANGYDFFYRQHVVKPALIGMLGAWISGGVEWNVPHHHRATSFSPVDYTTQTNADGSATIWVGEIELRHRMKWLVGMTLYPDRSCLELTCKMFNRTPFVHPMLFWINTAVHANTNYQVIFPPATEWVTQHSKPEFASWPIARQTYGGTDYTRGVDISWWKNHPNPVSFFCWNYQDDWFGGYDHGRQAGVVHVADHHVAPGKKFFEWGNGPEGEMWSKILTDEDGPYLELMAGAWSDNQPDYSWIQPGETREWKHWWYPIKGMGGVKNANRDAAVNLEVTNRVAKIAINATREFKRATVRLALGSTGNLPVPSGDPPDGTGKRTPSQGAPSDQIPRAAVPPGRLPGGTGKLPAPPKPIFDQTVDLGPAQPFAATVMLENETPLVNLCLSVLDADAREIIAFQPAKARGTPMPKPVERPKPPKDYASNDELYFTGQRIEQLYSPSFEARPYYEEMLRRDPGDSRAHTALGILLCKQWRWDEAAKHLSNAVARATANSIRPKDGEAFYYLGVALRQMEEERKWDFGSDLSPAAVGPAAGNFQSASWSADWRSASLYALAEIECRRWHFDGALENINRSLATQARNPKALCLKSAILRRLERPAQAKEAARSALVIDPLDAWGQMELVMADNKWLSSKDPHWFGALSETNLWNRVASLFAGRSQTRLEVGVSLAEAGFLTEAFFVLLPDDAAPNSLRHYHAGLYAWRLGVMELPGDEFERGRRSSHGLALPFQFESVPVLKYAISLGEHDAAAPYLLGNLLYDVQPDEAVKAWETARDRIVRLREANRRYSAWIRADEFKWLSVLEPLTHRNLALAYAQHERNIPKAIASLEKAVALDPKEPRFFYELDVQYEAGGAPVARRLEMLAKHHAVVAQRDDALTREIVLLTVAGQPERALALLRGRHFRNWEGSSQIHNVYVDACLARGKQLAAEKQHREALRAYEAALEYPVNLEVGKARRAPRTAQIQYLIGTAHEALGDTTAAKAAFEKAVAGRERGASEPGFFHALALRRLGRDGEARPIFEGLVKAGEEQLAKGEAADYFAKFGEKQSERVRRANAHYLIGLGHLGLGDRAKAEAGFKQALELHPAHPGAAHWRRFGS